MSIFGKHRIRASFYHIGAFIFIDITALNLLGFIGDSTSFLLTGILFVIDYLAQMFDPHPDNMGAWYERYFHRMYEDDTE